MAANQQYLAKGFYQYAQVGTPVSVQNYIFVRKNEKKCLLIRFTNELEYVINSMEFIVVQMDAAGKILDRTPLTYHQLQFLPGGTFVPQAGLVVAEACTDFRVIFVRAESEGYEYVMQNGRVVVRFQRKPEKLKLSERIGSFIPRYTVKVKHFGILHLAVLIAVIGAVLILLVSAYGISYSYFMGFFERLIQRMYQF